MKKKGGGARGGAPISLPSISYALPCIVHPPPPFNIINLSLARAGCKKILCLFQYPCKIKFIHSLPLSLSLSHTHSHTQRDTHTHRVYLTHTHTVSHGRTHYTLSDTHPHPPFRRNPNRTPTDRYPYSPR